MKCEAMTERDMREAKVPWPHSITDLTEYVNSLIDRNHDYGTCVYAMSMAAVAAYNHVAHKLGVTGFQASCADLDILKRTRHMEHGFSIINYENVLYPQYWKSYNSVLFLHIVQENREHLCPVVREKMRKVLVYRKFGDRAILFRRFDGLGEYYGAREPHPNVWSHWRWLLSFNGNGTNA
jgi:hypothetical protein